MSGNAALGDLCDTGDRSCFCWFVPRDPRGFRKGNVPALRFVSTMIISFSFRTLRSLAKLARPRHESTLLTTSFHIEQSSAFTSSSSPKSKLAMLAGENSNGTNRLSAVHLSFLGKIVVLLFFQVLLLGLGARAVAFP